MVRYKKGFDDGIATIMGHMLRLGINYRLII